MPQIGPLEIAVVLLIALLVFGPNRLPELARQAGAALKELRRIQQNIRQDLHEMMSDESDAAAPPPTLPPKTEAGEDGGGQPFEAPAEPGSDTSGPTASEPSPPREAD
jgi:sec-independent protein translocase protein TatA